MVPQENIVVNPAPTIGVIGVGAVVPCSWPIMTNFLGLLHGGSCLEAEGIYGPHINCSPQCIFSKSEFRAFANHRSDCVGDSCDFPNCREAVQLYQHFVSCQLDTCRRCWSPLIVVKEYFKGHLLCLRRYDLLIAIHMIDYMDWKVLLKRTATLSWIEEGGENEEGNNATVG